MANFIVLELARELNEAHTQYQPKPEKWFYTGRSFIAGSTAKTVDEIMNNDFYLKNFNRQCDEAFGTWESVDIHLQPEARNKPTLVKVLDLALPLMA